MEKRIRKIGALVVLGIFVSMALIPSTVGQDSDADWYEVGTASPPDDITDDIYTFGKVGIGTVIPLCTLHIKETTPETETILALESELSSITTGDHLGTILFMGPYRDGLGSTGAMIRAEASGPFTFENPDISPTSLQFYTQGRFPYNELVTPRMVITDEGNVGIGTTNPGYALHVIGDTNITGSLYAGSLNVDSGALYIDDVNDRVGIGTTDPQYPLEVVGDVYFNCSTFEIGSGTFWYRVGKHTKGSTDNYRIAFDSKNEVENAYFSISAHEEKQNKTADETLELVRVLENGNVGIATLSPTQKLHVNGSVRIEEHIFDSNNDQGTANYILRTTAIGIDWIDPLDFAVADADWDYGTNPPHMYSLPTGNVGIGETNPSSKLEVNGDVELTNLYDNDATNFFEGGATASETVTGITSTGQIQTTPISIDESQVSGEIESVTAGDGLTGGGASGDVTLDVGAGDGIDVFTDTVAVDVTDILGTGLREDSNNIGVYGLMAADGSPTNVVYVANDGKVGIGTTNPLAGLRVATDYGIKVSGTSSPLGNSGVGPEIWYDGTWSIFGAYNRNTGFSQPWRAIGRNFQFYDDTPGAGVRMVIDTQGYVGIGTAAPIHTLHVAGDAYITDRLFDGSNNAGSDGQILKSTGSKIEWVDPSSVSDGDWIISGSNMYSGVSGNIGIGTTDPDNKLHIFADSAGTASSHHSAFLTIENSAWAYMQFLTPNTGFQGILFGDTESSEAGYIEYCHGENSMRFNVNGDRAIFIDNQRRVGIGTTSPDEELHVVGNIKMVDGNQGTGKVLTSDANGVGSWQAIAKQNLFETIDAPGGTDPIADNPTDTLQLIQGGIVTITGDATNDRITIDATEVDGSTTNELQNLFETMTDGTNNAVADSQTDVFKYRGGGIVSVAVANDDPTHGDNVLISATEVDGDTTNELQNLAEVYAHDGATGNAVQLTAANGDIRFYNDDTIEMLFLDESSGRVGIGTTNPTAKLEVSVGGPTGPVGIGSVKITGHQPSYDSTIGELALNNGLAGGTSAAIRAITGDSSEGYGHTHLAFYTTMAGGSETERLRIKSNGNVGIGTNNPQGALDIVSTTGALIVPRMTTAQRNALTGVNGMIVYDTTANQFYFYENGAWTNDV